MPGTAYLLNTHDHEHKSSQTVLYTLGNLRDFSRVTLIVIFTRVLTLAPNLMSLTPLYLTVSFLRKPVTLEILAF